MGEYAIRKSDGTRIKIGTCEDMYYLRFEDRFCVQHEDGNVDPAIDEEAAQLRFRIPFIDEDNNSVGDYDDYNRSIRLYRGPKLGSPLSYAEDFSDESLIRKPGTMQLHHESGLLLNVPCYHGMKLPEVGPGIRAFWNGKSHSLVLSSLRGVIDNGEVKLLPVVRCRHCNEAWRYEWAAIWDYIPESTIEDKLLKVRLGHYAKQWKTVTV